MELGASQQVTMGFTLPLSRVPRQLLSVTPANNSSTSIQLQDINDL